MALIQISEPIKEKLENNEKNIVIGIDLGTTNSLVAYVEDEKVVFCSDDSGKEIIPSIVNFSDEKIAIHSIKRLMGKSLADISKQSFPFEIITGSDEKSALKIKIGDNSYSAAEISAKILSDLKKHAEKKLNQEVKKAVITVPAYFDEAAKNATKLAAEISGLEVLRLVNEPTAAALAYGLDNQSEGTYCVFDLGGGTFDVSILKMHKGVFKVLGVAGDNNLGGDDFDDLIAKHLKISSLEARKIKEKLSFEEIVEARFSDKNVKISRQEFEELSQEIVNKTISITENLIEDLDLEIDDIKGLILVGGSTRMPVIKDRLIEIFSAKKVLDKIDPDRIVAAGAAWQAHNLSGNSNNLLLDVLPLSLGIEMMGGIVDKIIHRNSTIPVAMAKEFTTYADNQTGMKLHIVQGERELAKDCRSLANFEIKNIPPLPAGIARILVTFKVDADGLLTVSAQEKLTQETQEIVVKPSYGIDENEVKNMLMSSLANSKSDMENRLLIQAIVESKKDLEIIKKDLKTWGTALSQNEIAEILQAADELKNLINLGQNREEILQKQKQLSKTSENLVLIKVNNILNEKISGKKVDELN